jgi:8-oxo-dGTP pyrophosphatase MutT (NUDIX family)
LILVAQDTANTTLRIESVKEKLNEFLPNRHPERKQTKRSAVTIVLHSVAGELSVLMIERAKNEGDPWSGHMAFPGGRVDPTDAHTYGAALRECEEEVGLRPLDQGALIGRLSDLPTHWRSDVRDKMFVTPFVFELNSLPELTPNYEVADTVWIPLSYLADEVNRQAFTWSNDKVSFELPCYHYQGKKVWGLSLAMLDELMAAIDVAHYPQRAID